MAHIRKNFSFQLLYALTQVLFPLATYPYLSRTIGANGLGKIGYIDYVSGLIITVTAFGIPFYGVREIAKTQGILDKRQQLFSELFSVHFLSSLLGTLLFVGLILLNPTQAIPLSLLLLGCFQILLPPFIAEWYLQGVEAFRFITIRSIILRLLALCALFLFVKAPTDFVSYFFIVVLVQVVVGLTNLYRIGFPSLKWQLQGVKRHLKPLWHFFLTTSIISLYVFFDVIILGWFANEMLVGYYALAIRIVKLSLLFVLSLNVILFPRISQLVGQKDVEQVQDLFKKAMQFIILITLPISAVFYLLSPQLVSILAGKNFNPSVNLIKILSALPLLIGFSNLLVYQLLVPFQKEKDLLKAAIITCIFSVISHIILVQWYASTGTALATLLTESCMTVLTAIFAYRIFSFSFPVKVLIQSGAALIPFIIFGMLSQAQFKNSFVIVGSSLLPGMLVYALLQFYVFNNTLVKELAAGIRWTCKGNITNG